MNEQFMPVSRLLFESVTIARAELQRDRLSRPARALLAEHAARMGAHLAARLREQTVRGAE